VEIVCTSIQIASLPSSLQLCSISFDDDIVKLNKLFVFILYKYFCTNAFCIKFIYRYTANILSIGWKILVYIVCIPYEISYYIQNSLNSL
jgi:hypothetical protein